MNIKKKIYDYIHTPFSKKTFVIRMSKAGFYMLLAYLGLHVVDDVVNVIEDVADYFEHDVINETGADVNGNIETLKGNIIYK